MENVNFVKNGVSRLPPGFRFQPTDEEIVFQYLKSKVFSCPLPASIIPEINVSNYDPWDLPGNCDEQERYFFSCKEGCRYRNGSRMNRTTKSGYWKATGSDKRISSSSCDDDDDGIVGIRKTLVFYKGKSPDASKTHWVLHEYRLAALDTNATTCNSTQNYVNGIGDWVLCRLLVKNRNNNNNVQSDGIIGSSSSTHHHHMMHNNNNSSSSVVRGLPRLLDFVMPSGKAAPSSSTSSSSCSSSTNFMEEVSSYDHDADTNGRYHHS